MSGLITSIVATTNGAVMAESFEPELPHPIQRTAHGAPLFGLADVDLAAFVAGREEFESIETPEGGLGPIFDDHSCVACHSTPVSG